jgi:hypothetical protein
MGDWGDCGSLRRLAVVALGAQTALGDEALGAGCSQQRYLKAAVGRLNAGRLNVFGRWRFDQ